MSPRSTKIQRWIDLLAALLGRQRALTFDEIAKEVPGYLGGAKESVKRTFERDKRELKALGVVIESDSARGDAEYLYRLRTNDFYLPYLALVGPDGTRREPKRVDKYGYHSLRTLAFAPDELEVVVEAAVRAQQLGNAPLAADADNAVRKLAYDLPVGAVAARDDVRVIPSRVAADDKTLELLADALHDRRVVQFTYETPSSGSPSARTAEPYGLFFLKGHWYLAARDVERDALRNFRVNRIRDAKRRSADKEQPDYAIPATFDIAAHAGSRHAWELGDATAVDVTVALRGKSGAAVAAFRRGRAIPDGDRATFAVRRADAFVRWLLSFAGELVPVAPPDVVRAYDAAVRETLALYDGERTAAGKSR